MITAKTLTGILGVCLFLTVVSSARADVVHPNIQLEKLMYVDHHNLTVLDFERAETGYLYAGHFENNNGKHLGFSVATVHRGPRLGIVRPESRSSVSQNPEPTTMVLLGTGLVAVAAFARKKRRQL